MRNVEGGMRIDKKFGGLKYSNLGIQELKAFCPSNILIPTFLNP
jgi:hypothetical protein